MQTAGDAVFKTKLFTLPRILEAAPGKQSERAAEPCYILRVF